MKIIILITTILISSVGYTQTNNTKNNGSKKETKNTIFETVKSGETQKIVINTQNYSSNDIGYLKDALLLNNKTITNVVYDENMQTFSFNYSSNTNTEHLVSLFKQYRVNYKKNNLTNQ